MERAVSGRAPVAQAQPQSAAAPQAYTFTSFEDVILKAESNREIGLKTQLEDFVHLVSFESQDVSSFALP